MISFSIFWNFPRLLEDECRENVGTNVGTNKKQPEAIWLSINRLVNLSSDPAGTRTQDPYIKSVLLYQLSYGIISFSLSVKGGAKIRLYAEKSNVFGNFFSISMVNFGLVGSQTF
jgi:hypothetical protein